MLFEAHIEQALVPTLKEGMVVIIDTASFQNSLKIKQLIEDAMPSVLKSVSIC